MAIQIFYPCVRVLYACNLYRKLAFLGELEGSIRDDSGRNFVLIDISIITLSKHYNTAPPDRRDNEQNT